MISYRYLSSQGEGRGRDGSERSGGGGGRSRKSAAAPPRAKWQRPSVAGSRLVRSSERNTRVDRRGLREPARRLRARNAGRGISPGVSLGPRGMIHCGPGWVAGGRVGSSTAVGSWASACVLRWTRFLSDVWVGTHAEPPVQTFPGICSSCRRSSPRQALHSSALAALVPADTVGSFRRAADFRTFAPCVCRARLLSDHPWSIFRCGRGRSRLS